MEEVTQASVCCWNSSNVHKSPGQLWKQHTFKLLV